jgi:hypothetical protein
MLISFRLWQKTVCSGLLALSFLSSALLKYEEEKGTQSSFFRGGGGADFPRAYSWQAVPFSYNLMELLMFGFPLCQGQISNYWKAHMWGCRDIDFLSTDFFFPSTFSHQLILFHFGVLHPVARALSRLSGKPSFAITVQGVYCIYTSTATCFSLHWPSSGGIHNIIYKEVIILTTDLLSVVQIVLCTLFDKCCRRLLTMTTK